jgi:hypothetical protein
MSLGVTERPLFKTATDRNGREAVIRTDFATVALSAIAAVDRKLEQRQKLCITARRTKWRTKRPDLGVQRESDFCLFGHLQRIFNLNAKITYCAFEAKVTQ